MTQKKKGHEEEEAFGINTNFLNEEAWLHEILTDSV